jgi:hypothetical protein
MVEVDAGHRQECTNRVWGRAAGLRWRPSPGGMTVTPPGDEPHMSTQLRLVESPATESRKAKAPRARVSPPRGRRVHWSADWRLDDRTRRTGRQGVAAAREALQAARPPEADLPRAS